MGEEQWPKLRVDYFQLQKVRSYTRPQSPLVMSSLMHSYPRAMPQSIPRGLFQEVHAGLLSHSYVQITLSQHRTKLAAAQGLRNPCFYLSVATSETTVEWLVPLQVIIIPGLQQRLPAASTVTLSIHCSVRA